MILSGTIIFGAGLATLFLQRKAAEIGGRANRGWDQPAVRRCGGLLVIGAVLLGALSTILLVLQLTVYELTTWTLAWIALIVAVIWALVKISKANLPVSLGKNLAGGLSISIFISLVGAAYTDFYLPSKIPEVLSVSVSLDRANLNKVSKVAYVPFSIKVNNPQKVGVYVLAAYYEVIGRQESISPQSSPLSPVQEEFSVMHYQAIRPYVSHSSLRLLQGGPVMAPGDWLEPSQSAVLDDTISVPIPTAYDAIQIICNLIVMRNDRATLSTSFTANEKFSWIPADGLRPSWVNHIFPHAKYIQWRGQLYGSYLQSLLMRPRIVTVWYILPGPTVSGIGPEVVGAVSVVGAKSKEPTSADEQAAFDHYGLSLLNGTNVAKSVLQLGIPTR